MDTLQPTVFQIVETIDFVSVVTETILAGAVLGILVSLINMAGSRD